MKTEPRPVFSPHWFAAFRCAGPTLWRPAKASVPWLAAAAEPGALAAPRQAWGLQSPLRCEENTTGPSARMDTKLGIINSRADLLAMTRVIKVNGTRISSASICIGGSALTRSLRGETNWIHKGHAPCSVLFCKLVLNTHLRKTVLWMVTKNLLCCDRNQMKKKKRVKGNIPFLEYSKCQCKLSMKEKLIFSPLQTPASLQFPRKK